MGKRRVSPIPATAVARAGAGGKRCLSSSSPGCPKLPQMHITSPTVSLSSFSTLKCVHVCTACVWPWMASCAATQAHSLEGTQLLAHVAECLPWCLFRSRTGIRNDLTKATGFLMHWSPQTGRPWKPLLETTQCSGAQGRASERAKGPGRCYSQTLPTPSTSAAH